MNSIQDFHYLAAVADHLHFGMAAEACHVSQPTLSGQIRKMEDNLGFQIFERSNRKVIVTTKGKEMVKLAREVIEAQNNFKLKAKEFSDPVSGEIKLGLIPTLAPYLLPIIMPELSKKLQDVRFILHEHQTKDLLSKLDKGQLDALILPWLDNMQDYRSHHLFNEPLLVAMPKAHALNQVKKLTLADLKNQTVLTLKDGHCLRDQTLGYCFAAGANENTQFSATSLETLRYMVAGGTGITLIPKLAVRHRNDNNIVYREFEKDIPYRDIVIITRPTSTTRLLIDEIAKVVSKIMN